MKGINHRPAALTAKGKVLVGAGDSTRLRLLLDLVDLQDKVERGSRCGLGRRERAKKATSAM